MREEPTEKCAEVVFQAGRPLQAAVAQHCRVMEKVGSPPHTPAPPAPASKMLEGTDHW